MLNWLTLSMNNFPLYLPNQVNSMSHTVWSFVIRNNWGEHSISSFISLVNIHLIYRIVNFTNVVHFQQKQSSCFFSACLSTYSQNTAYIFHYHRPCYFLLVFTFLQVNLNHVTLLLFFVIILLYLFEKCFLLAFSKDKLHLPWILTVRSRLLRNACNLFFTGWVCVSMHKSIEGRPGCSHRAGEKVGPYPTYMHRIKLFSTAGITWWDKDFLRTLRVTVKPLIGDKVAWWLGYYSLIQEV